KLAYSADGKTIASTGEDRIVRLFNAANVTEKKALEKQPDWAPSLALSADAKKLVVGRMDGTFAVYDTATGNRVPPAAPELAMGAAPLAVTQGVATPLVLKGKRLRGLVGMVLLSSAKPADIHTLMPRQKPVANSSATEAAVTVTVDRDIPTG